MYFCYLLLFFIVSRFPNSMYVLSCLHLLLPFLIVRYRIFLPSVFPLLPQCFLFTPCVLDMIFDLLSYFLLFISYFCGLIFSLFLYIFFYYCIAVQCILTFRPSFIPKISNLLSALFSSRYPCSCRSYFSWERISLTICSLLKLLNHFKTILDDVPHRFYSLFLVCPTVPSTNIQHLMKCTSISRNVTTCICLVVLLGALFQPWVDQHLHIKQECCSLGLATL